ncbi:MAG: hypothetical protein COU51_00635 [Parcubacteria group bacterium CG10_big_fil_rev_8_21_14_0_10_36_14]|nr:MAG: hypothetical protein COU51_00635 [Parcubacteria group bacterium CG10_big_fil_rev_8_21_14_0_10_36_14]
MILRGIDFGKVLDATGARGFFGEGYWYHKLWWPFGLNFEGSTFVAKTTTLEALLGNMDLDKDYRPKKLFPDCVKVYSGKGVVLNAVGLSGPGAEVLFEAGKWQKRQEPFFISFMPIAGTVRERRIELLEFMKMLKRYLPEFQAPIGLQINFSCPNVNVEFDDEEFVDEIHGSLALARCFVNIPLMPKFSVITPPEILREVTDFVSCDAICISNTIPWGKLPNDIDWKAIFGTNESPLAKYGGGGLSGKPLLALVVDWIMRARDIGITKPINAGGGVLSQRDAELLFYAGADSIFLGSVAMLAPWKVKSIIAHAQKCEKTERSNTQ